MAKRWFPGTVFGFCSGTLLVIGLNSLRTDHPAIGKQTSWPQPASYDTATDENPRLDPGDAIWSDLARTHNIKGAVVWEAETPQSKWAKPGETHASMDDAVGSTAACPVEEFFAKLSEFRYRYLFEVRDDLGFLVNEQPQLAAPNDHEDSRQPGAQDPAAQEVVFDETAEPQLAADDYGFFDEYGTGESFAVSQPRSDTAAEAGMSAESEEIAEIDLVEREMANAETAAESDVFSDHASDAAIDGYQHLADYDALYGDYYEEAWPEDVVGRRPCIRHRSTRHETAPKDETSNKDETSPKATEDAASAGLGVIRFPSVEEYAQVHREEDWEARVAATWVLARNDAAPLQFEENPVAAEDRPLDVGETLAAGSEWAADSASRGEFEFVRDEGPEPLGEDYSEAWMSSDEPFDEAWRGVEDSYEETGKSNEGSLPVPEADGAAIVPVWDTPMHGEPGENFRWEEVSEETAAELPAFPQFDSAAAGNPDADTGCAEMGLEPGGKAAWDFENPGYAPAANSHEVSHVYEGDYYQSEDYRYFEYEESYREWRELHAALTERDAPETIRMEVVLPALMRAVNTLPELLSRSAEDARRGLAQHFVRLLSWPRTAAKPDASSVK
ncbi:MAG: hypothetical protein ACUVQK_13180 [Thermogutta sp.]